MYRSNFLCLFLILVCTQTNFANCIKGSCKDGFGKVVFTNGGNYEGFFVDFKFHGEGVLTFRDGSFYKGTFQKGKMNGKGIFTYKEGHLYQGQFLDNKKHGKGTIALANGDKYSGDWINDKMEGLGKYTFDDGSTYEGQFKINYFEGEGTLKESNGKVRTGLWQNNKLVTKEKTESALNCNNSDCHNCTGVYTYQDGTIFKGFFIAGRPNGYGQVLYKDGAEYLGEWSNNAPNGKGKFKEVTGKTFEGHWKNGNLLSNTSILTDSKSSHQSHSKISNINQTQQTKGSNSSTQIYALIVGVASYNHMPSLKYTDDDAYRIYSFLKSPEGGALNDNNIQILVDENATTQNIKDELLNISKNATVNDLILVYFAGHGVNGYFIPYDFNGKSNKLGYNEIESIIETSPAKNKVVIVDACHSGSLQERGPYDLQLQDFYTKLGNATNSTAFITSSKSEETSLESSGFRQGVFSHFLIKGLKGMANKNNDHIVSLGELYEYLVMNVKQYSANRQNPTINGDYDPLLPLSSIRK